MSLEGHYAPLFTAKTGAPAKPFQMAFGAVYIQQRLGLTDRETVALITESPYMQFVNLAKPHVRPIVRGKASKKTEFGALADRLSLAVDFNLR